MAESDLERGLVGGEQNNFLSNIPGKAGMYWTKYKKYYFVCLAVQAIMAAAFIGTIAFDDDGLGPNLYNNAYDIHTYNKRDDNDKPISCDDS